MTDFRAKVDFYTNEEAADVRGIHGKVIFGVCVMHGCCMQTHKVEQSGLD